MTFEEKAELRTQVAEAVVGYTILLHAWLYLINQACYGDSTAILDVPIGELCKIIGGPGLDAVHLLNDSEKYRLVDGRRP